MQKLFESWATGAITLLYALAPGAFGSLVSVLAEWEKDLPFSRRVAQWVSGILVSHYVGIGIYSVFQWNAFGIQSVQFVCGMIAFKAAPGFIDKASEVIVGLPQDIRDKFFPRKPL